jgi:hypothetical protein
MGKNRADDGRREKRVKGGEAVSAAVYAPEAFEGQVYLKNSL